MPMPPLDLAQTHQRQRRRITARVEREAVAAWREVDERDIRASWLPSIPRVAAALSAGQHAAASEANSYVGAVVSEYDGDFESAGRVNPAALSGLAADGRALTSLLLLPAVRALRTLGGGGTIREALASGQSWLRILTRTEIADAGRVADGVAVAATPTMGYVRHVSPPSCPRCAILAGRWYRYSSGFERHPGCDCTMVAAPQPRTRDDVPTDLTADPKRLLREGQVTGLSKADRKAILEDGADMNRVINAHRGMYTASGKRKLTTELSGVGRQRLRPESIYREATSREDAVRLLRLHGYLV